MIPRRVGILGGMGPEATVLLMSKIIAGVLAVDDRDHVPLIVDQNPQVPSRIERLIAGTGEDPKPILIDMARRLERAGARALAMPCNTAHYYAAEVAASVRIPFINMVTLSVARARRLASGMDRVGILASPAVRRVGLFDAPLREVGLTAVYAADDDAMLEAIRRIKAVGINPHSREAFRRASAEMLSDGVSIQMVACTEFSLIASDCAVGTSGFDTLDVLVEGILDFSCVDERR
jgi:aspartate racemase